MCYIKGNSMFKGADAGEDMAPVWKEKKSAVAAQSEQRDEQVILWDEIGRRKEGSS